MTAPAGAAHPRVRPVATDLVPKPTVPYSHALIVEAGRLVFVSGQGPADAQGVSPGDIHAQVEQAFANVQSLLEAAGGSLASIVEITVYLRDMSHRAVVTEVRRRILKEPYPTSTMVEISRLAFDDWLVEISAIAAV